jgi:hypothetical protein
MQGIASDMDGGLDKFLQKQREIEGKVTLSLYDFSSSGWWAKEQDQETPKVRRMEHFALLTDDLTVQPIDAGGGTPLCDAEGIAITETGKELAGMKECDRPARVIIVVITDGGENASEEYNDMQIAKMIKEQTDTYSWQFTFLGANQDAYAESAKMGIAKGSALNFSPDARGVENAFESLTSGTIRARSMCSADYQASVGSGQFYSQQEQEQGDIDAKGSNSNDLQGSSS